MTMPWIYELSKRPAADFDINLSDPKSARTSVSSGGVGGSLSSAVGGSAADSAQQAPVSHNRNVRYIQMYDVDTPWNPNGEDEAWKYIDTDHVNIKFDTVAGVNLVFTDEHFKIFPYGPLKHTISNTDECSYDVPPGNCVIWKYGIMFISHYNNTSRAIMTVELNYAPKPGSTTVLKDASPQIEEIISDSYKTICPTTKDICPPDPTKPCWFPLSKYERQTAYWKAAYLETKQQRDDYAADLNDVLNGKILLEKKEDT